MTNLPRPSALLEPASNNFTSGGISNSTTVRLLPNDFTLGDKDVICGRGTTCFNHIGNEKFRELIKSKLDRYLKSIAKVDKTLLIYEVVSEVRAISPNGGFVKLDKSTGQYYEVGDFLAREKTSQGFRDALHEHYKSSNIKKKIKRKILNSSKIDRRIKNGDSIVTKCSTSDTDVYMISPSSLERSLTKASKPSVKSLYMLNESFPIFEVTCSANNLSQYDSFTFGSNKRFAVIKDTNPSSLMNEVSETSSSSRFTIDKFEKRCDRRSSISSISVPPHDDDFDGTFMPLDYEWTTSTPDDFDLFFNDVNCSSNFIDENFSKDNVQGELSDLFELSDDILKIEEQLRENRMFQSTLQKQFS